MTSYNRQTKPDAPEEPKLKLLCGVDGCEEESVLTIGGVERCARHYTDEVDRAGKDASRVSGRLRALLRAEREEMQVLGPDEYRRQASERIERQTKQVTKRQTRKDRSDKREIEVGPTLREHMSDEEFFAKNPGWQAYKPGEEDLFKKGDR